jgi:hypothetical protein
MSKGGSDKKKRDAQITYRHKIELLTKWYNKLIK